MVISGKKLKDIREARNMSREDLGAALGLSSSRIYQIEAKEKSNMKPFVFRLAVQALSVTAKELEI